MAAPLEKKKGGNPHVPVGECLLPLGMPKLMSLSPFIMLLAAALPGCAVYEKCGLQGCPGDAETTARVNALFDRHPVLVNSIGLTGSR